MLASWWRTCLLVSSQRLVTRAFAGTSQARELLEEEKASLFSNRLWFGYRIKHPECFGYVYLWYDRKQRKLCIGSHHKRARSATAWDGYLTSTGYCKKEIEKRPADFRFCVLEYNVDIDCLHHTQKLEQKWLDKIPEKQLEGRQNARYYNQCRFAGGGFALDSLVAAKISVTQKKAVADGTHHFIHSNPSQNPIAKEKMRATIAKAVANGTHHFVHSNPMKDPAIKERAIAKMKITVAKAIAEGTHNFVHSHPSKSLIARQKWRASTAKLLAEGTHHFIRSHPMKDFAIKERAMAKRKITVAQAVANGTHHFVHSNPSKNPVTIEKRKATIAKSVADGTHHFVCNNPMNNPATKEKALAKRKITVARAVANGTHHFVRCNPMKDPESKAKRKPTIEKK